MWKYKLTCPFGGLGLLLGLLSLVAASGSLALLEMNAHTEGKELSETLRCAVFCLPLAVLAVCFAVVHWRTRQDREAIADAEPPEWRPLLPGGSMYSQSNTILLGMQHETRFNALLTLGIGGVALVIVLILLAFLENDDMFGYCALIGTLVLVICLMIRACVHWLFWKCLPENVEYCTLDAAYSYRVPAFRRRRPFMDTVIVWYLPDGKYRVYLHDEESVGTLFFIRWHGIVRWIHWKY